MHLQYRCLGASKQVTGSAHYLEIADIKILIDFGMMQDASQKSKVKEFNERELPINVSDLDYVFVTHAHLDHIGLLPRLIDMGYKGDVYTTVPTMEMMKPSLVDCAYLMRKKKVDMLYTATDVDLLMERVRGYSYNTHIQLTDNIVVEFMPAGHITGAAMVYISIRENQFNWKHILFSGDTSAYRDIPFTQKPEVEDLSVDYIITETTYGIESRNIKHETVEEQLYKHVKEIIINGRGTIIVPVFSIGRSTNMLYYIKRMEELYGVTLEKYLASPLAITMHNIVREMYRFYPDWEEEIILWKDETIQYIDSFENLLLNCMNNTPKIIFASSGMVEGGYSNFLVQWYSQQAKNLILFSGYQGDATNGRKLLTGLQKNVIIDNKKCSIKCSVDSLSGLSSHASATEIIDMYKDMNISHLKKIILVHGDNKNMQEVKTYYESKLSCEVLIPNLNQTINL